MSLIKCTNKLLKEMGVNSKNHLESDYSPSYLGSWHANLIFIDSRKCILFCNDKTRFNFIAVDVTKKQTQDLKSTFKHHLSGALYSENLPKSLVERIISEYEAIDYTKSSNKSVLATINDLAFHYKHAILEAGEVHSYTIPDIIHKLNNKPMGIIGYSFPIEKLKRLYENET